MLSRSPAPNNPGIGFQRSKEDYIRIRGFTFSRNNVSFSANYDELENVRRVSSSSTYFSERRDREVF